MLQCYAGTTNNTTLHKTERVTSKGGYQELQSTNDWKRATEAGVKTMEIMISVLGIK